MGPQAEDVESGLAATGSTPSSRLAPGSGTETTLPADTRSSPQAGPPRPTAGAEAALRRLIAALRSEGVAVGLHTCALPPWPLLADLGLDVLNVDVVRHPPSDAQDRERIRAYLEAGGRIAWGLVPATANLPTADALVAFANKTLSRFGAEALRGSLISPCCGLAGLGDAEARAVERSLREMSTRLRQAWS